MDDERSQLSTEISQARSRTSLDRTTPAPPSPNTRSRSRTSLNRRPLVSPASHHPRRMTLPSSPLKQPQHSSIPNVADNLLAHAQSRERISKATQIASHVSKPLTAIDRKPLPYHPLSHLGAGRFYDPGGDWNRRHHRLRERASWSKLTKESTPAWPPQATRDLLKEAGEWLDLVYPYPASVEDGEVGSLQSPSSSGSFETLKGSELGDRLWTQAREAVSLTSLGDDDEEARRSTCGDHVNIDILKDEYDQRGDDTDKEIVSMPRKIGSLRGEKIVVSSLPSLPSTLLHPSDENLKPITHDGGRESKVREQLVMLQGLNSPEGNEGGIAPNEWSLNPHLAELDATPVPPNKDSLARASIPLTTRTIIGSHDSLDHEDNEKSISDLSSGEPTPQRSPEYINLPIDLGDEQFSAAIAEALGFDRSPAKEEPTSHVMTADHSSDSFLRNVRNSTTLMNSHDAKTSPEASTFDIVPTESMPQAGPPVADEAAESTKVFHHTGQPHPAKPPSMPSSCEITPRDTQSRMTQNEPFDEETVTIETALPSSPNSEKNETVSIFSDLENLALASQRFSSSSAQTSNLTTSKNPAPG